MCVLQLREKPRDGVVALKDVEVSWNTLQGMPHHGSIVRLM